MMTIIYLERSRGIMFSPIRLNVRAKLDSWLWGEFVPDHH